MAVIPGPQSPIAFWVVWTAMGTSVFRIRTAVDFPPVLKSDHTMRSCRAASLHAGRPDSFKPGRLHPTARKFHAHQRLSQTHGERLFRNLCLLESARGGRQ